MGMKLWRWVGMGKINGNRVGTGENSQGLGVEGANLFHHVTLWPVVLRMNLQTAKWKSFKNILN